MGRPVYVVMGCKNIACWPAQACTLVDGWMEPAQACELRALTRLKEKLLACMHVSDVWSPRAQTNYAHNHKFRRAIYL